VIVLVLLSKFVALTRLVPAGAWALLLIVPLIARSALVLLFLTTDYVRAQGLGSALARHLPRTACKAAILVSLVGALFIAGKQAFWMSLGAALLFLLLRDLMLRRIGGTTGDTAGALLELTEPLVAIIAAFLVSAA
jgi:adenosylcobinamide-GDP ribazoletransferase